MNDDGMNDDPRLDRGLTADLAALRGALREVHASDAAEQSLLAALEARAAARPHTVEAEFAPTVPSRARRAVRAWRVRFAVAAAAALAAVTAVLTLGVERGRDVAAPASTASASAPVAAPQAAPSPAPLSQFAGAFQPLAFSPGLSPSQSYSVVRVRIPIGALTPGHSAPPDATIEADLLVGEDGLASAIRFDKADTLFVSTASTEMGERR